MSSTRPIVVAYGGGVNSCAMLCEFAKSSVKPTAILFADTGGEKPATYEHIAYMSGKADSWWGVPITIVKYKPVSLPDLTLEDELLRLQALPSLAYGWRTCSQKWKHKPQADWINASGLKPIRLAIGFDAGEQHRLGRVNDDPEIENWYPLAERGLDRSGCKATIMFSGVKVPPKSSCFFCPAMKRAEIFELQRDHPDLMKRALAIEEAALASGKAGTGTTEGLGRRWAWRDALKAGDGGMFADAPDMPCMCADGGDGD